MNDLDENQVTEEENINESGEQLEDPIDFEMEPPKNDLLAIGEKKLIDALLKKKIILIGSIAAIVLLFFILILSVFDTTDNFSKEYKETSCKNVTINYVPYNEKEGTSSETMDLESYVRGATYVYSKNIIEPGTAMFQVYYSLAVALRNEAISNNCTVTYRDKTIPKTFTANHTLEQALKLAEGVVMVDSSENIIPTRVADFCWHTPSPDDYIVYQGNNLPIKNNLVSTYGNNQIYKDCRCNEYTEVQVNYCKEYEGNICWTTWPYEEEVPEEFTEEEPVCYAAWLHQDETTGYNVMGATYLLMEYGKGYTDILKYFFGNDINYMTTIKNTTPKKEQQIASSDTNCSLFSLTSTTLSKDEFVEYVRNYTNVSNQNWPTFQMKAGDIYDMGVDNDVNPELIIVRAILEGFSPGAAKHNYFGINCINGQPEKCTIYDSFDEGIMGFISTIQKYNSYVDLTKKYAYLGDYWFNPGGSGDGGCYYAKHIYPNGLDEYVSDACSSAREDLCVAGKNGNKTGCVVTREEDRTAYSLYQGRNMTDLRKKIFDIESNSCVNNTLTSGSCVLYSQSDSRWSSTLLGNGNKWTIGNSGCALTSVAIAMSCTGLMDTSEFSPLILNNKLKENGGFVGADIYWDNEAIRKYIPSFRLGKIFSISKSESIDSKIKKLQEGLMDNRVGIVHIENTAHTRGHFVVLKSIDKESETFTSLDPDGGKIQTYSLYDVDGFKYYTY